MTNGRPKEDDPPTKTVELLTASLGHGDKVKELPGHAGDAPGMLTAGIPLGNTRWLRNHRKKKLQQSIND